MTEVTETLDQSLLQPFQNAAGHDGVLCGADGEVIVKPCTQAEVDFYQETVFRYPGFAEHIPTFMGTLTLGPPVAPASASHLLEGLLEPDTTVNLPKAQGKKIAAETAIVLENLEYGFVRPSVIDIKLGARLYAPGTATEKAARLDKVAADTTTGSLHFRIAGMKVWNPLTNTSDLYDKHYGRSFDQDTVNTGIRTYLDALTKTPKRLEIGIQIIAEMLSDLRELRIALERRESRFYSASVLIVFEGDPDALRQKVIQQTELHTSDELQREYSEEADLYEDEIEESEEPELAFCRLKMIDFAHSTWCPGQGRDENVITGLLNIEKQLQSILNSFPKDRGRVSS